MTSNFTDTNITLDDFEIIQTEVKLGNELDNDIEIIQTEVNPNDHHNIDEDHEETEEHQEESEEHHEESEEHHEESEEHHEESEEHHVEEHAYLDNHEQLKDNYADNNGHVHGFVNEDGNFIPYDHEDNEHYHNKESYEIFGENFENKVINLLSKSLTPENITEINNESNFEVSNIENFENQETPEINSETDENECLPFDISSTESISSVWKIIDSYDIKNIYKTDKDGNNLFHYLIENNDIEYIDKLYNYDNQLLIVRNNCNETPIDRIKDKTVISNFLVQKLIEENKYMKMNITYLNEHIDSVKYNFDLYTILFFGIVVLYFSYKFIKSNSLFIFGK